MQAMTLVKSIADAAETYYLANGSFPTAFSQLDISLPADWTGTASIYNGSSYDPHSNGEWSIVLENNGGTLGAIHMGKITGDYVGAGFSYYVLSPFSDIPAHQLLCMEVRNYSSYVFGKTGGDFCVKVFKGTNTHLGDLGLYTMP